MPKLRDILPYAAESATNVIGGRLQENRKRREDLEDAIKKLFAEEQIKNLTDPERAAKSRIMALARISGRVPEPLGGYTPQERQVGAPESVQEAAQQRELAALQYILPRSSGLPVNVFTVSPSTGETMPSPGGQNLPPGSRIVPTRTSPEEVEELAAGRTRGALREKPPSQQTASAQYSVENLGRLISQLKSQFDVVQTVESGPGAVAGGVVRAGKAALASDPKF